MLHKDTGIASGTHDSLWHCNGNGNCEFI